MNAGQVIDWLAANGCAYPSAHLKMDSREIAHGDVFVAVPGTMPGKSADGRSFIAAAVARGAGAVLGEAEGRPAIEPHVPTLWLANLRTQLGDLAARFYGAPTQKLLTIGVTRVASSMRARLQSRWRSRRSDSTSIGSTGCSSASRCSPI